MRAFASTPILATLHSGEALLPIPLAKSFTMGWKSYEMTWMNGDEWVTLYNENRPHSGRYIMAKHLFKRGGVPST
jgi:hypothetical protein